MRPVARWSRRACSATPCDPDRFNSWLDYVDTYLAVWVMDYAKGANLCQVPCRRPALISRQKRFEKEDESQGFYR